VSSNVSLVEGMSRHLGCESNPAHRYVHIQGGSNSKHVDGPPQLAVRAPPQLSMALLDHDNLSARQHAERNLLVTKSPGFFL